MRRDSFGLLTKTARFSKTVVSFAQKALAGQPAPAYRPGVAAYADWVFLAIQRLKEYLNHDYWRLIDVLQEMPRVTNSIGLSIETLPYFSTVCARKQEILVMRWRAMLDSSVEMYNLGGVKAIEATGVNRV